MQITVASPLATAPFASRRLQTVGVLTAAPWHDSLGDIAASDATGAGLARRRVPAYPVAVGAPGPDHLVIGGGDLLYGGTQEPWASLLARFRVPGPHVLNAVGVDPATVHAIDWTFTRDYLLVSVRDDEIAHEVSRHVDGIRSVPCPATLIDPLPWDLAVSLPGYPGLSDLAPGGYVVVHRHPAVERLASSIEGPVVVVDMQAWASHPWRVGGLQVRTHSPGLVATIISNARAVVAHSLHIAILAIGRATPFSVVDTGDRQSDKVRRYLRRAGFEEAMLPAGANPVAHALGLRPTLGRVSAEERLAAATHLDEVARVLHRA
jgi:hypothetical protein